MVLTRDIAYHQQGRMPSVRHPHTDSDSLEIIQILSGDGNTLIGDQTYPLSPGILLFIDASTIHSLNPQCEADYCHNKLVVSRNTVEKALRAAGAVALLETFDDGGGACFTLTPETAGEVDEIFCDMTKKNGENTVVFPAFLRLLTMLTPQDRLYAQVSDPRVARVLHFLHTRYTDPITIDMLAEDAHISKYYLCRLFRASTGMSIVQYLNEQRLTSARRLLAKTSRPITSIAQDCGFGSPSHFCALFREREGMTPRDFRNLHSHGV